MESLFNILMIFDIYMHNASNTKAMGSLNASKTKAMNWYTTYLQ